MTSSTTETALTDFDIDLLAPRAQRVVLVCDVVESVRWMESHEDEAIARWSAFAHAVRSQLAPAHSGDVVKSTGDGLMIEFSDPRQAVSCAHALHSHAAEGNTGRPSEQQLALRVGIHQAPLRRDQHDLYGHGANLAARITTLAGPGEIIVTPEVRDHLTDSLDGDIEDMGECYLKHVSEPQRVYRVGVSAGNASILLPSSDEAPLLPMLAVLNWDVIAADKSEYKIGELIADGVSRCLSRSRQCRVLSRLSCRRLDSSDPQTLKRLLELKVDFVLAGTGVLQGTDRLTMAYELVSVKTQEVLESQSMNASLGQLLESDNSLGNQITEVVIDRLVHHATERASQCPIPSVEGYALHLGAVNLMHRFTRADFFKAQDFLRHLAERHSRWSTPHVWHARWHMLLAEQGWSDNLEKTRQQAIDCAKRGLDRYPGSALAHTIIGVVQSNVVHDLNAALQSYQQALSLDPNESLAWLSKGMAHAFRGEADQAVADIEHACKLSPLDPQRYYYTSLLASAYLSQSNYEKAVQMAKESLRHNSQHASTWRVMTIAHVLSGDVQAAGDSADKLLKVSPSLTVDSYRARSVEKGFVKADEFADALAKAGIPLR